MGNTFKKNQIASIDNARAFSGGGALFVGLLGLTAWITGLRFLASIRSAYVPMSPDTALAFVCLGLILFFHVRIRARGGSKVLASAVITLVSIYGLLKSIEYFVGADLTFANILFPATQRAGSFFVKRMSPIAGVLFFLSGIALQLKLLLGDHRKSSNIIGGIGVITLTVGFVAMAGYVFGTPLLYGSEIIPLAATTAVGFFLLGFGLVAISGPENIFVRTFSGDTARARLLRYFLPMTVIGVLVQGFLSDTITGTFGIEHTLADALFSLAFAILMSGVVVQLLNVMLRRADRAETERKRVEGELRRTSKFPLENPNPILRIGGDGSILFANRASAAILTAWDRQTGEKVPGDWQQHIEITFKSGVHKEVAIDCDGQVFSCILVPDMDEGYVDIYGSDHTERKQAEDEIRKLNAELETRVAERTALLEVANKELDAFVYSVSHDLRAPLRSIDGFSLVLLEDYAKKLDEKGKDSLQRVRAATQRMGQLIDDLLSLSRVSRSDLSRDRVHLSAIADGIAAELRESDPGRDVVFVISPDIHVTGDAHLLQIVLDNLMRNAFKFTSKHAKARIEFGQALRDGTVVYYVRDDGAGFDMKYADKMFGAFQRMHSSVEFPGMGIGLVTVQRIINRHGGRVWAEGEVEKGATFYFTLQQ